MISCRFLLGKVMALGAILKEAFINNAMVCEGAICWSNFRLLSDHIPC